MPSIVFFNGGFTDAGNEAGLERHRELLDVAGRSSMAVAGPNCMGLLSRSGVRLRASSLSHDQAIPTASRSCRKAAGW